MFKLQIVLNAFVTFDWCSPWIYLSALTLERDSLMPGSLKLHSYPNRPIFLASLTNLQVSHNALDSLNSLDLVIHSCTFLFWGGSVFVSAVCLCLVCCFLSQSFEAF